MKARKKPVEIDYLPYTRQSPSELKNWVESFGDNFEEHFVYPNRDVNIIQVKTLEGTSYDVTTDDVIIRGVKGEYYPCKKDIFYATYDITV